MTSRFYNRVMQLREACMPNDDTGLTPPTTTSRQTAWQLNLTAPQQAQLDPLERNHLPAQPQEAEPHSTPKPDFACVPARALQKAE